MSFIYGANGSYIRDKRPKKQNTSSYINETEKVNPNNLVAKFNQIQCKINKEHGNYDFVCVAPNCPYDRLICIDCFKDVPEKMQYMQQYGKFFLRMNKFVNAISKPELSSKEFQKMEDIRKLQGKLMRLTNGYDKQVENEMDNLKEFFKKAEDGIIDVVKKAMRKNYEQTLEEFTNDSDKIRKKLDNILRNCKIVTKFGNRGHLQDLSDAMQNVRSGGNENVLIEKVNQIVDVFVDMGGILDNWVKRIYALGKFPERVLKPKINYMELGTLYKQKEIVISEELENVHDLDMKDQYRYYSSNMDNLLSGRTPRGNNYFDRTVERRKPQRSSPGKVRDFFNLGGGYSFVQGDNLPRNERSLDFTKNLDISKINEKSVDDLGSLNNISMLDLDPVKTKRMQEIDRKINDIFGDSSTNRAEVLPRSRNRFSELSSHKKRTDPPNLRSSPQDNALKNKRMEILKPSSFSIDKPNSSPINIENAGKSEYTNSEPEEEDFGRALESLNTSFKIPRLQMIDPTDREADDNPYQNLRRDLAKSLASSQSGTYRTSGKGTAYQS